MKKPWCKGDIWLFGGIVLVALLLWLLRSFFAAEGTFVQVSVEGKSVKLFAITDKIDLKCEGVGGYNRLRVENGKAWIEEADCPDGICQHHAPISRTGDSIICLPHRLTVTVIGDGEAPDAVVS